LHLPRVTTSNKPGYGVLAHDINQIGNGADEDWQEKRAKEWKHEFCRKLQGANLVQRIHGGEQSQ
jgi:hypothetical protein